MVVRLVVLMLSGCSCLVGILIFCVKMLVNFFEMKFDMVGCLLVRFFRFVFDMWFMMCVICIRFVGLVSVVVMNSGYVFVILEMRVVIVVFLV